MSFEPIDWDEMDDVGEASQAAAAAMDKVRRDLAQRRTTKRVQATLTATFHGEYVPVDEIPDRLSAWLDRGFEDRDDLRGWTLSVTAVTVETGDPDGYDR